MTGPRGDHHRRPHHSLHHGRFGGRRKGREGGGLRRGRGGEESVRRNGEQMREQDWRRGRGGGEGGELLLPRGALTARRTPLTP